MPELPDVEAYIAALGPRIAGKEIEKIRLNNPFLLRTAEPRVEAVEGLEVVEARRLGKRVILVFPDELFLVFHLMIAGRFRWGARNAKPPGRIGLAAFTFPTGALLLTEASKQKRAALYVVQGETNLAKHDRGGLEVMTTDEATFRDRLMRENRTLKRALTDPRLFSGIGNAYSDEILHAAQLSPITWTTRLSGEGVNRLYEATVSTLRRWIAQLQQEFADRFPGPGDITAFREGFAVHGRFDKPE